jgi:hypothetical protein
VTEGDPDEEIIEFPEELVDESADEDGDTSSVQGVLDLLNNQAGLLTSVSTRGPMIQDVNKTYVRRRRKLNAALRARGIPPPFPYGDLWEWHGHYSQELGNYASRRRHISALATPARDALENALDEAQVSDPGSAGAPTWAGLDARVEGVANELRSATSRDDLQDVGRRCREILIDAAKLLADPSLVPQDCEPPKAGDAKAWLELFLQGHASGRDRSSLRALIRPAWDLAQRVTHGDIDRVDAYAAAQATILIVRTLQLLA